MGSYNPVRGAGVLQVTRCYINRHGFLTLHGVVKTGRNEGHKWRYQVSIDPRSNAFKRNEDLYKATGNRHTSLLPNSEWKNRMFWARYEVDEIGKATLWPVRYSYLTDEERATLAEQRRLFLAQKSGRRAKKIYKF